MMEKSKVSRAASRLAAAGYIAKQASKTDRRLVQMSLTEKGKGLMSELLPLALSYQRSLEAHLGDGLDGFEAGIARLLEEF